MMFIVATNVFASRLPQHQPTGMPSARANLGYGSGETRLHFTRSLLKPYHELFNYV